VSTFAAILEWDSVVASKSLAEGLAVALTSWRGDSVVVRACPGATLGTSLPSSQRRFDDQPLIDEDGQVGVLADCRLDNADELRSALSLGSSATGPALIREGYRRWGDAVSEHLRGDFACVVWDWKQQRCLAFRDPLGIRPLYYSRLRGGLAISTDSELIIRTVRPSFVPDDRAVVEYLLWEYTSQENTFWSSISRLPAGHSLSADSRALDVIRYWKPNPRARSFSDSREAYQEFSALFLQSVRQRLECDEATLIHLSGGLDSASIACAAARFGPTAATGVAPETISQRFPGMPWDEHEFIRATTEWTRLKNTEWDGTAAEYVDLTDPSLVGPGVKSSRSSGSNGDLDIALSRGVHVILSGEGGDHVGFPTGCMDDLIDRGRLAFAAKTLIQATLSWTRKLARIRRVGRHYVPVEFRRRLRSIRYRRNLPEWLQPPWRGLSTQIVSSYFPSAIERSFEYHVQRAHWHDLTSGRLGATLDSQQRTGARCGVEYRYPFLDQTLVEFVLSLPPDNWPAEGGGARLHRDALREILPPTIRDRRTKANFSGAIGQRLLRARRTLEALFHRGEWCSVRYVRRSKAQELLRHALAGSLEADQPDLWRTWVDVRAIATLEAWLRTAFGYTLPLGDRADGQ
jgi:asparagine synthase (glutamine-hydrolysing)